MTRTTSLTEPRPCAWHLALNFHYPVPGCPNCVQQRAHPDGYSEPPEPGCTCQRTAETRWEDPRCPVHRPVSGYSEPGERDREAAVRPPCSWCARKEGHRPNCPRPDERFTAFDLAEARRAASPQPKEPQSEPSEPGSLRDRIAAAVWAHQNATMPTSWTDFCGGNYTCWPHREADAILAALSTEGVTR